MQKSVLWGAVATSLIGLVVVIAFLVYPAEKNGKKDGSDYSKYRKAVVRCPRACFSLP